MCEKIKILGFITIKRSFKSSIVEEWRKRNKHNNTNLENLFLPERITVGNATYGNINAIFSSKDDSKLLIGNFCSIGAGVKFIVSSEHPYECLSTYPFKTFYFGEELEATSKGSIVVKDDVWIGINAIVLSGVTVGQGAIIGAGSVVTKDVPPYAIVGGNPAKVIKYRFSSEIIEKLKKFNYATLSADRINKLRDRLYVKITSENVDELLNEIIKGD